MGTCRGYFCIYLTEIEGVGPVTFNIFSLVLEDGVKHNNRFATYVLYFIYKGFTGKVTFITEDGLGGGDKLFYTLAWVFIVLSYFTPKYSTLPPTPTQVINGEWSLI